MAGGGGRNSWGWGVQNFLASFFFQFHTRKKEKFSKFSFMLQILIGPIAHVRNFLMLGTGGARTGDKIASLTEL